MEAIVKNCRLGKLKGKITPVLVFSNKVEAAGLPIAESYSLTSASISSKGHDRVTYDSKVRALIDTFQFDYIVLAGYMRILSPEFVQAYPNKIINIHPADTKVHQGLHAYEWAFEQKLPETKITVHYVEEGLDTGPIIGQKRVDLRGAETLEEVEKRGLKVEHQFYSEMLLKLT